jgi:chromosome segregation ATPase
MQMMKSLSQRAYDMSTQRKEAHSFGGHVEPVNFEIPGPPVPSPALQQNSSDVLKRLSSMATADPKRRQAIADVAAEVDALLTRLAGLEDECDVEKLAKFRDAHVDVRAKGRQILKQMDKLSKNAALSRNDYNEAAQRKARAFADMTMATEGLKKLNRFASDEEADVYKQKMEEARERVRVATADERSHLSEYNSLQSELAELRNDLGRLAAEEERLRKTIDGQPFYDPEFGLSNVATAATD